MFKNIFPDDLNRLVYQQAKKGAPKKKEVVGAQPQAPSKKPKSDPQAEGKRVMDSAAKKQWNEYCNPKRNPDKDPFQVGLPRQERMNRLIRAYKALREVQKGKNSHKKSQRQLRELFVASAIEITTKEITGRSLRDPGGGIFKRLGLDDVAKKQKEVSPKEREILKKLADDFTEFITLDKKNPSRFTVRVPLRYHNEIGGFVADVGYKGPTTTFEINGNVAKVINSTRHCLFMNDVSIYKLSGALAICTQAKKGAAEGYGRNKNTSKKINALVASGKEFDKWMKHPTETFTERMKRVSKKR